MIKIIVSAIIILSLIIGCKKNDSNAPGVTIIDAKGRWLLSSFTTTNNGRTSTITATDYPCILETTVNYNDNGEGSFAFIGTDTCFLERLSPTQFVLLGVPGEAPKPFKWTQNENTVNMTSGGIKTTGNLTILNSKPAIILDYTAPSGNYTSTSTFVR